MHLRYSGHLWSHALWTANDQTGFTNITNVRFRRRISGLVYHNIVNCTKTVLSTTRLVLPQTQSLPVLSLQQVHRLGSTLDAPQIDQVSLLCVSKLLQLRGPRVVEACKTATNALVEQVAVDLQGVRAVRRLKQHPNVEYTRFNQTDNRWIQKRVFKLTPPINCTSKFL